jgi:hypothetical protein
VSVSKEEPEEEDEEGPASRVVAMADEGDIAVRRCVSLLHPTDSPAGGLRSSIFKQKQEREWRLQGLRVLYVLCTEGR